MPTICLLYCFFAQAPADGGSARGDWDRWVRQRDESAKTGPTSFLNLNDAAYLEPGSTVYLDAAVPAAAQVFAQERPADLAVTIRFDRGQARVSIGEEPSFDLLERKTYTLPNGLVLAAESLTDGAARIRLHNPEHPAVKAFEGLRYYAFDESARVHGRFVRATTDEVVYFQTMRGRQSKAFLVGHVEFEYQGRPSSLKAYCFKVEPPDESLFVPFKDQTTGSETYAAGRYLDVDIPAGLTTSEVIIDFNRAYNPLCARSKFYNCARVPDDALDLAIRAGERGP